MLRITSDEHFMKEALKEARLAFEKGEIPVGAVVVCQNQIIARGHNLTEQLQDVTAHAEVLAITAASNFLHSKYLTDCTMFVSLEPCVMCAGALFWAQIGRLVYGASDEKRGFMRYGKELLHPRTKIDSGILQKPCAELMQAFFQQKRK